MRRKLLLVFAISLFLLSLFLSAGTPVRAQGTGQWITSYTVTDLATGKVLESFQGGQITNNGAILAGADLKISFTITVTAANPSTNLQIATPLAHSSSQGTYWQLDSQDYSGINGNSYNPNQQSVTFSQVIGTLSMTCYGSVNSGITQTPIGGGFTLDQPAGLQLIALTDPSGNTLDQIQVTVIDSKIDQYNTLLTQAQTEGQTLSNNGVDPAFTALYQSVISDAQSQADQGLVDNAIATLNQLASTESSNSPGSSRTPIEATLFLPAVAALAIIVVLVGFLFIRTRGKVTYDKMAIEDQIKELEGLTLRAQRVDKSIAANLDNIKERLKSIVGES